MERRVDLVIDPLRRETVTVSLPLGFRRSVQSTREELELAPSVDLSDPIVAKAVALAGVALERIDLRGHSGVHPRIGALDVLPFVPLQDSTLDEAAALAPRVGTPAPLAAQEA